MPLVAVKAILNTLKETKMTKNILIQAAETHAKQVAPVVQMAKDCSSDSSKQQPSTMPPSKTDPSASSFISRVQSAVQDADLLPEEGPICASIYGAAIVRELAKVKKFHALTRKQVENVVSTNKCGLILNGTPGLGKTHVVKDVLNGLGLTNNVDYLIVKGHVTGAKLYQILWMYREKGKVVILDDCDTLFAQDLGLTILKAALDPDVTTVSYETTKVPILNGKEVPCFSYEGTLIVCTNVKFSSGYQSQRTAHLNAIQSRANVWPVLMSKLETKFANIFYMVIEQGYLDGLLDNEQKRDLLDFIWKHKGDMPRLDLRDPKRIAEQIQIDPENWIETAEVLIGVANV
jgi:uncharacterized protein YqgV (UPF0045/DUF77 family)